MTSKSAAELWALLPEYVYDKSTPDKMRNGVLAHLFFNECGKKYPETIVKIKELTGLSINNGSMRSKLVGLHNFITKKLRHLNSGTAWTTLLEELDKRCSLPVELPTAVSPCCEGTMFLLECFFDMWATAYMSCFIWEVSLFTIWFLMYFEGSCKSEFSRKFLLTQLHHPYLVGQLTALGLVGKLITGPWMQFVYRNGDELSNFEMSGHFKTAKSMIDSWCKNPSQIRIRIVEDVLQEILPAVASVVERQLNRHISGDLSTPSQELINKTASAAPHNMWAERVVGMTCNLWKRCPMATVGFLDAKIKAKTNKLMEWLDSKDKMEQEKLVAFGRKRAGALQKIRRVYEKGVDKEIEVRMSELAQARSMKSRKGADKQVKAAYSNKDADAAVFQSVSGAQRERLNQLMERDERIVGALFIHKWYDAEQRKDCTWQARVIRIGKKMCDVCVVLE